MNKKALISGLLTLALCLSVMTGATFALFTGESTTNIAATSGKVEIVSTATLDALYSPKALGADGTITNAENIAGDTFANGGTVEVNGTDITLQNMTPGDKAIIKITMTNRSDVAFVQRLMMSCVDEDKSFFNQLLIGVSDDGTDFTYCSDFATAWEESGVVYASGDTVHKYVSIELPGHVGNKYQGKSAHFFLNLHAVQGNAAAEGEASSATVFMVHDQETFDAALAVADENDAIYFTAPVAGELVVSFTEEKTVTIRGYHINKLTVNAPAGTVHVYNDITVLDAEEVAMHSLHVYGDVASLRAEQGRVVVEYTAEVSEATLASRGAVTLSMPATVVDSNALVGTVDTIIVEEPTEGATVKLIVPDEEQNISGDGKESATVHYGYENWIEEDTKGKKLYIGNATGFRTFGEQVNAGTSYAGWTVFLVNDIDLENKEWTAIGSKSKPFSGSFDGQGHTISNLKITKTVANLASSNRQGLFGTIIPSGATFFGNMTLHNVDIVGGYHVGGVVATSDGSSQTKSDNYLVMSNVKLTGKVTIEGWQGVAGVMGSGNMAELSDIVVDVEDGSYVSNMAGGPDNAFNIVASVKGGGYLASIRNITSNLDVKGKMASIGGLFGVVGGQNTVCTISDVSYSGTVTVMTSSSLQWNRAVYSYNGLIIGTPRFNVVADPDTCTSTGALALHIEDGTVLTDIQMTDVYAWGNNLFGASRDNAYANKSYCTAYVAPASEEISLPVNNVGSSILAEETEEN